MTTRAPSKFMQLYSAEDARRGRNDPCPWGSGYKAEFIVGSGPAQGRAG
jgi:uncharacterized protein YecA (UPF0149 family)